MFKKFILCSLFIIMTVGVNYSQSIMVERIGGDTTYGVVSQFEPIYAYAYFKNITGSTIYLRMARIAETAPSDWTISICYQYCYAPFIHVVPDTTIDPFTGKPFEQPIELLPGQQDTMDLTVNAYSQGTSHTVLRFYDVNNSAVYTDKSFWITAVTTNIQQISTTVEDYKLSQNYPNPFNPSTQINFSIPKNDNVTLKVYDMLGNEVADLINNESLFAGSYNFEFNTTSYNLTSGVYFYKLTTAQFTDIKKMMLIK